VQQNWPSVSLVVTTYNRWPLVGAALRSAVDQERPFDEVILVDDGSTDGTAQEVASEFPQVRVIYQENAERGAARNRGLQEATGDYVVFLDADDLLEPWFLSQFEKHWRARHGLSALYVSPHVRWYPELGALREVPLKLPADGGALRGALRRTLWHVTSAVVPRELARRAGGFPAQRTVARSEDWLFQVRLLALKAPVVAMPQAALRYRQHPANSMGEHEAVISSRLAALSILLGEGLAGRSLAPAERRVALAGAHSLCAAHAYHAGQMRRARRFLLCALRSDPSAETLRATSRLFLQSLLGARVTRAARRLREQRALGGGRAQATPRHGGW